MAPVAGFAFLLLVFLIGILLPIYNFFALDNLSIKDKAKKHKQLQDLSFALIFIIFISSLFSQICLIYSYVISDYSVINVFKNSHHYKPLIFKISGSWGNHEGSMLLLITVLSGYSLAFNLFSKIDLEKKIIINSSQSFIIGLFAAFTAFTSNPFLTKLPAPKAGLGLNPILQDIGLALHPPMLYVGYIGFSLVFSFIIAGLITEKINKNLAKYLNPWLYFSWAFLTLGIGLGSWWAYRELGWGGYWFWDPVENISLMPWIAGTALIHSTKILEKKGIFKSWCAFLAILTFILCLLGIFLTRSGILSSVHSFAIDADRGFFIIGLLGVIGGVSLLIFGAKVSKISTNNEKIFLTSKLGAILFNNYFLVIALFIVVLGTVYPIFSQSFFNQFLSIGPEYYNRIFTILIIPFLLFLAISTSLKYNQESEVKNIINLNNVIIFIASIALTSLIFLYDDRAEILQVIILFLAILAALKNIYISRNIVMSLCHLGFCLIIIGVVLTSSFGLTKEMNIKQGEVTKIGNYDIRFMGVEYDSQKNFVARQGNFIAIKNNALLGNLKPQLRYYPAADQTTNEASIINSFVGDLYLVIGNKDENDNYALRVYFKPFIYLIWFGCGIIFLGAIIGIIRRLWG